MRLFTRNIYLLGAIFALVAGVNAFVGFRQMEAPIRRELEQRVEAELEHALGAIDASFALVEQTLNTAGYYLQVEPDGEKVRQFLVELKKHNPAYLDIGVQSFTLGQDAGGPVYTTSIQDDQGLLSVSKPVYGPDQEPLAVVRIDMSLAERVSSLEELYGYKYFFFLDGRPIFEDHGGLNLDFSRLNGAPRITELLLDDVSGYLHWDRVGTTDLVAAAFVPDSSLVSLRRQERWIAGVFAMNLILGAAVLIVVLRRHILFPVRELGQEILAISLERDVAYRLHVDPQKPLRSFREALNLSLQTAQERHERILHQRKELSQAYAQREENERVLQGQLRVIKESEERIQFLAEYDYLTKLYNRRKFQEDLENALRIKGSGALFLLDIDDFKNINDTQGHSFGDGVLVSAAALLQREKPPGSTLYRFGGDEFALVITDQRELARTQDNFNGVNRKLKLLASAEGWGSRIGFSVGGVRFPQDGTTLDQVLIKADIALHHAKREGKGRVCLFDDRMAATFSERVRAEHIVAEAVQSESFYLVYQPVVDAQSGKIASFEAFVRVQGSLVSPSVLISIAEESDLIYSIGYWVIREVTRQLAAWIQEGIDPKPISLNISTKQFYDRGLTPYLQGQLEETGVDPSLVQLEITEDVMLGDPLEAIDIMHQIRSLGLALSLDNYGTGYSFVNYLTKIPVDYLKIHGVLTQNMLDNPGFMQGLISIAHGLGMKVVAEQVETAEQAHQLKAAGSDYLQGYLFSKLFFPQEAAAALERDYGDILAPEEKEKES